ncbi:MAG: hypothetical protein HC897_02295 [Thermoanaerobaculia bacterium]|nr:hypothetical protein [Thermoanaerobaculia bacterium]
MKAVAWGSVTTYGGGTPKIESSSGNFEVTRLGKGLYTIYFTSATFTKIPAFVVTQQFSGSSTWGDFSSAGGDTKDNAVIVALSSTQAKIKTGEQGGNASDRNFSFIAIGD